MGRRPSEILGLISEPPGLPPLTGGPEDDLWSYSPERTWYMRRRPKIAAFVALAVALVIVAGLLGQPPRTPPEAWWSAIVGAIGLVVGSYCLFPYGAARKAFKERQRWMSRYRAEEALRRFDRCESGIPIDALFRYNRRQLDAYQELSRNQQRLAFRHAQAASLAGLVVLVVGVALSFRIGPGGPSYAVAGLTGLGAALSAFIAQTFVRSARQADQQLNLYYQDPHMMGRVVLAGLMAHRMTPDARSASDRAIIDQILTWPLPASPEENDAGPGTATSSG